MKLHIEITQADIDGSDQSPTYCPVARAVKRVSGATVVRVTPDMLSRNYFVKIDCTSRTFLADDVSRRIRAYDDGLGMLPFDFDLEWPA